MDNFKAKMFNKRASDPKNRPDQIIKAIGLKPGQNIADIGAGGGYFSLRFAEIVGEEGKVYAVDTNPKFLEFIQRFAKEKGISNVLTLLAEDELDLPEGSLNFIFMRNVTHHLVERTTYFTRLRKYLKPDGKIIIIEYKPSKSLSFRGIFKHYVAKETIIQEMKQAGYILEEEFDFLPEQHFTIHSKG